MKLFSKIKRYFSTRPCSYAYRQISNVRRTNFQNLNVSRLVLNFSLPNPLEPGVKSKMKMQLEWRWQAMLQLHLSDQEFHCLLKCVLYQRCDGRLNAKQPGYRKCPFRTDRNVGALVISGNTLLRVSDRKNGVTKMASHRLPEISLAYIHISLKGPGRSMIYGKIVWPLHTPSIYS